MFCNNHRVTFVRGPQAGLDWKLERITVNDVKSLIHRPKTPCSVHPATQRMHAKVHPLWGESRDSRPIFLKTSDLKSASWNTSCENQRAQHIEKVSFVNVIIV